MIRVRFCGNDSVRRAWSWSKDEYRLCVWSFLPSLVVMQQSYTTNPPFSLLIGDFPLSPTTDQPSIATCRANGAWEAEGDEGPKNESHPAFGNELSASQMSFSENGLDRIEIASSLLGEAGRSEMTMSSVMLLYSASSSSRSTLSFGRTTRRFLLSANGCFTSPPEDMKDVGVYVAISGGKEGKDKEPAEADGSKMLSATSGTTLPFGSRDESILHINQQTNSKEAMYKCPNVRVTSPVKESDFSSTWYQQIA